MPALWDTKQRQGHCLHRICAYQASFPPQLPAYFLDRYPEAQVVLDPFCGRGTVLLEATLRGKEAIGIDVLPVAVLLSSVKIRCPSRKEVLDEIAALDLSKTAPEMPEKFKDLYHPQTWQELWNLREAKKSDAVTALALGRLHGHSPGFFSTFTFNVVSIPPAALKRQRAKFLAKGDKKAEITYRDVKRLLLKAANKFIPVDPHNGKGRVERADSRKLPLADESIDLVITSPPFLDVVDYQGVNWVRQWFVGADDNPGPEPTVTGNKDEYAAFLKDILTELKRVVRPSGTVVFEVGPVKKEAEMDALVLKASEGLFPSSDRVVNEFAALEDEEGNILGKSVPKISRAMKGRQKVGKNQTTTMSNVCLVLKK